MITLHPTLLRKSSSKATIRLDIIYKFRAASYTETSQGPLRHAQIWFGFNTLNDMFTLIEMLVKF